MSGLTRHPSRASNPSRADSLLGGQQAVNRLRNLLGHLYLFTPSVNENALNTLNWPLRFYLTNHIVPEKVKTSTSESTPGSRPPVLFPNAALT
jgi:hypothetical protein